MKKFNDYNDKIEYIMEQIYEKTDISIVMSTDTAMDILTDYEHYFKEEVGEFLVYVTPDETDFVVLSQFMDAEGNVTAMIESLFNEKANGEFIIKEVEAETILVEDGVLDEEEFTKMYFEDELIELLCDDGGYCDCGCCTRGCICEEDSEINLDDLSDDEIKHLMIEETLEELSNSECAEESYEVLSQLLEVGIAMGVKKTIEGLLEAEMVKLKQK